VLVEQPAQHKHSHYPAHQHVAAGKSSPVQRRAVALSHSSCFLLSAADAAEAKNERKMLGQNADLEVWSTVTAEPIAVHIFFITFTV